MKTKLFYFGTKGNVYPDNTILHVATLIDSLIGLLTLGLIHSDFGGHIAMINLGKQVEKARKKRKATKTVKVYFKLNKENEWLSMRGECKYISSHHERGMLCNEPGRLKDPVGFKLCEHLYCPGMSVKKEIVQWHKK